MTASGGERNYSNRNEEYLHILGQHEFALAAFVHAIAPSWHDAEEILQETRITLWREFDKYQPGSDFCAWAFVVAHYLAKTYFKRRQRSRRILSDEVVRSILAKTTRVPVETDQRLAALAECMRKLSRDNIAFLRRRYVEKRQVKEIAVALGRSLPGTYAALSRIRLGLLRCVQRRMRQEDSL